MAEGNAYYAEPDRLAAGVRQINAISSLAHEMLRDFTTTVNDTRGWPGRDDSFAQEVIPAELKERETAVQTGSSLVDAVVSVADGTMSNLSNIRSTQMGVMDSINSAGSRGGRH
ncbi:hypothetical protein ACKI1I_08900 [Streptomyces turgidiscabies]|uniref:WXG100 family type VII secretion target n=1 Tax=Streptomyces turgidiscabies (strain Car8) TaxID=698760 RepID=L7FIX9_STRT8|nr:MULTISPECIES: hypothetical protein [Streptomyces]ELP71348.1 hypothetical protein STRTUCAR8_02460 [Streptomyces turgidiscabies Car8]MDX3493703.1 hypothetical protein [Streptomyces turgidiscabies]GAQ71703.1 hypothetical protein T45_03447 [Streptomyces turgidiscabies]